MNKIKIISLCMLTVLVLGTSAVASGFISQVYAQPDYMSKPCFIVPGCVKIIHVENRIVGKVLWAHIQFTGFISFDGWIPICQWETERLPGRTK